jgi:phosphatidylglycerophosphatase A
VLLAGLLILAGAGPDRHPWVYNGVLALVLVFFTLCCAVLGDLAEAKFLKKDPSQVVADETAGQALPLLFLPAAAVRTPMLAVLWLFLAFVAFRLMDIIKPPPAYQIQETPGGWGLVLDDLVAGVYAMVLIQLAAHLFMH